MGLWDDYVRTAVTGKAQPGDPLEAKEDLPPESAVPPEEGGDPGLHARYLTSLYESRQRDLQNQAAAEKKRQAGQAATLAQLPPEVRADYLKQHPQPVPKLIPGPKIPAAPDVADPYPAFAAKSPEDQAAQVLEAQRKVDPSYTPPAPPPAYVKVRDENGRVVFTNRPGQYKSDIGQPLDPDMVAKRIQGAHTPVAPLPFMASQKERDHNALMLASQRALQKAEAEGNIGKRTSTVGSIGFIRPSDPDNPLDEGSPYFEQEMDRRYGGAIAQAQQKQALAQAQLTPQQIHDWAVEQKKGTDFDMQRAQYFIAALNDIEQRRSRLLSEAQKGSPDPNLQKAFIVRRNKELDREKEILEQTRDSMARHNVTNFPTETATPNQ